MSFTQPICTENSSLPTRIYGTLRALARRHLAGERLGHTLDPTALVHEAYLRLSSQQGPVSPESAGYLAAASCIMRRVLVDHARRRTALKRGGTVDRVVLAEESAGSNDTGVDLLALDESLERLSRLDVQLARIVELRFFGGMGDSEIAGVLGCSTRTVRRAWSVARAWLARELST